MKVGKYVKSYLAAFILGPLMMIVEVIGEVLMPRFMSLIVDHGVAARDTGYILRMGGVMVVTALLMAMGGILGCYFAARASIGFTADLREDMFGKVQTFSFKNIDSFSTGSLVTRLTNDMQQVQNILMMMLRMALRAPGMLIGAIIMAFAMNAKLAMVIVTVLPLLVILIAVIMYVALPRFTRMQRAIDRLNNGIQENLTNIRVVKSFVREDFEGERFAANNDNLMDASINAMRVMVVTMPLMTLVMNLTQLAVVWTGGNQIIAGTGMTVGDLTAFTSYTIQILMSLMMLSMVFMSSSRSLASWRRIREVMTTEVDLNDADAAQPERRVQAGAVEFRHVWFAYNTEEQTDAGETEWVLEDLNFKINPGETIGIIGGTGSGKTSMVSLIPRLYDAVQGEVLVDGVNVKDYSLYNLREGVGMVLQKNTLFSGSIEENLRWGDEGAGFAEIREMADAAQADGFVMGFDEGYEKEMGQGGVNVSGGQKQRLCIARALLKRPKILILDDSTSAVDTATERRIRACFETTLKDTTKLIIAQRIGSVEHADRIIVIDDGRIADIGTHAELLVRCTAYQEVYYSQRDREEQAS